MHACFGKMVLYMLPMLLGRTYDKQRNKVGIDIYNRADIEQAKLHPIRDTEVISHYMLIEKSHEKRHFLGISGDLALKISSRLVVNINGAGHYFSDTFDKHKSVEMLIRMNYKTVVEKIPHESTTLDYWHSLSKEAVGTHVVSSLLYGGEVFALVNFIAYKDEYLQDIKGDVKAVFSKNGTFNLDATGKLEILANNISSKAKMEIDYFANLPLDTVPTSLEGLKMLVTDFKTLVQKVNDGKGVAICAELKPLSDFQNSFEFLINEDLELQMDDLNHKFDNLKDAKLYLKSLISSLPDNVPEDYIKKVADFSDRLTATLVEFNKAIGDLDLTKGPEQFDSAILAFETNSLKTGNNRYTREIKKLQNELHEKDDPEMPRGIYTRWGKRSCGDKVQRILYIGYMSSSVEKGTGGGTEYQCLPENPDMHLDLNILNEERGESKLTAVRYKSLSVFNLEGKEVENRVASCTVCESFSRPTVQMFPASHSCPPGWVQEYAGFLVSSSKKRARSEFVCLDYDPEHHELDSEVNKRDLFVLPSKVGDKETDQNIFRKDASVPCAVCSK